MTLFEVMLVTHFVADWIFQSRWEANNKSHNMRALYYHCSVYVLFFVPVLALFHQLRISILILLWFSHVILDCRKFEFWIMKRKGIYLAKNQVGAKTSYFFPPRFNHIDGEQSMDLGSWWIIMIGIDQTLHLFVLGVIAYFVG